MDFIYSNQVIMFPDQITLFPSITITSTLGIFLWTIFYRYPSWFIIASIINMPTDQFMPDDQAKEYK